MKDTAATITSPAIVIDNLSKSYGRLGVLRSLSLEIPWGQFLVLLGPNGSGKTTLLRVLSTLARPTSGNVRIAGLDPTKHSIAVRRLIGVVTHQPLLYYDLTVIENLQFYARMFGLSSPMDCIEDVVATTGISQWANRRIRTLSHGMQKRVSIARALLHNPRILLLDEPETGLDPTAVDLLEEILIRATQGHGRTVVMTTHNLARGLVVGNQVAILSGGHIAYQNPTASLNVSGLRTIYSRLTGAS